MLRRIQILFKIISTFSQIQRFVNVYESTSIYTLFKIIIYHFYYRLLNFRIMNHYFSPLPADVINKQSFMSHKSHNNTHKVPINIIDISIPIIITKHLL